MSQDKKSDEAKKAFLNDMVQLQNEFFVLKEIIDRVNEQIRELKLKESAAN